MTIVCIAGMHRSGTSMIARLLNLSGLYLGEEDDFLPPAPDNPEGFWENYHFFLVNEGIISGLGGAWDQPPALEPGWENAPALDNYRAEAGKLVRKMSSHVNWGWKDPRSSLTLPFWKQLIPDLKVVVCLRDPIEVALSLAKRGASSRLFSMRLWQAYTEKMLQNLRDTDWILTHYDVYFQKPEAELRRLLAFLEMDVSDQMVQESSRFIKPDHKHNRISSSGSAELMAFPEAQALYSDLCRQAGPVYEEALQAWERTAAQPGSNDLDAKRQPASGTDNLIQNLRNRILRDTDRIQSLERNLAASETRSQNLESRILGLEYQLSEIYGSKGWRALQGFRRLMGLLRPAKRTPPY